MKGFKKYVPGQTDKESQYKKQLSDMEYLILKPHTEGIEKMTKEEIEEYINIDEEKIARSKMNQKTIIVFLETKKILKENLDKILKDIEKKEKGEEQDER